MRLFPTTYSWLLALLLCSCAGNRPVPTSAVGYPGPATTNLPSGYPGVSPEAPYPTEAVSFSFDKPLIAGAIRVTGRGLPGVPIVLHDVTFMGEEVAQSTISSEGTFEFAVPALEAGHRLGIALGDLTGTSWTVSYFDSPSFRGDAAMQVPNVGFYFDTVQVAAQ